MDRHYNHTDKIKLNGSYISKLHSNGFYDRLVFYRDGTMFYGSTENPAIDYFDKTNKRLKESGGYLSIGIYNIKGDTILIETNIPTFFAPFRKTKMSTIGKIVNDHTIITDIYVGLDTFYFIQHENKPDSTLFKFVPDIKD